ncbi:KS1 protein-like [Palaemon carinicauda]|uniref:KS1 protein-like n=1 Tax=Palaemon carinicauda TaxID=392227 RepID=UPI0035B625B6
MAITSCNGTLAGLARDIVGGEAAEKDELEKLSRMNWKMESIFLLKKKGHDELEDEIDLPVEEQEKEAGLHQRGEEEDVQENEEKAEDEKVPTLEENRSEYDSKTESSDKKLSNKKKRKRKLSKEETSNA